MFPSNRMPRTCVLYQHMHLDDSRVIRVYGDLSSLERVLRTMAECDQATLTSWKSSRRSNGLALCARHQGYLKPSSAADGEQLPSPPPSPRKPPDDRRAITTALLLSHRHDNTTDEASELNPPTSTIDALQSTPLLRVRSISDASGNIMEPQESSKHDATFDQQGGAQAPSTCARRVQRRSPYDTSSLFGTAGSTLKEAGLHPPLSHLDLLQSGDCSALSQSCCLCREQRMRRRVRRQPGFTSVAAACCPSLLPIGSALSAMASDAEFSQDFTFCHCIDGVSDHEVLTLWYTAVNFVAEYILDAPCTGQTHGRTSARWNADARCVEGTFVVRIDASNFSIGVVTRGRPQDAAIAKALADFITIANRVPQRYFTEVPIGAGLRHCTLRVQWNPGDGRIVPGARLPTIKVFLDDTRYEYLCCGSRPQRGWPVTREAVRDAAPPTYVLDAPSTEGLDQSQKPASDHGGVVFKGYNDVHTFLVRPVHSALLGSRIRAVPHWVGARRTSAFMPPPATVSLLSARNTSNSSWREDASSVYGSPRTGASSRSRAVARLTRCADGSLHRAARLSQEWPHSDSTLVYASSPSPSSLSPPPQPPLPCHHELTARERQRSPSLPALSAQNTPETTDINMAPPVQMGPSVVNSNDTDGVAQWQTCLVKQPPSPFRQPQDRSFPLPNDSHPCSLAEAKYTDAPTGDLRLLYHRWAGGATATGAGVEEGVAHRARYSAQVCLSFHDLSLSRSGEHLLGFEVSVEPNYQPFVPILTTNLAPFLVVECDEWNDPAFCAPSTRRMVG